MPYIVLSAVHVVLQVSKRQLRLDHPELRQMAGGVAVLCPAYQDRKALSTPCIYCQTSGECKRMCPTKLLRFEQSALMAAVDVPNRMLC